MFVSCAILLGLLGTAIARYLASGSIPEGRRSGSIVVGDRTRTYLVHLPPDYDGSRPLPIVIVLHGASESPERTEQISGMSRKADKENFIAVYPRGTGRRDPSSSPTWNSSNCCGYALQHKVDDVSFIRALIEKLEVNYSVDTKRIFVTGISNGAMLAFRLAYELSDKVAAIAPIEGAYHSKCTSSTTPVSMIILRRARDRSIQLDPDKASLLTMTSLNDDLTERCMAFWVKQNKCSPVPEREQTGNISRDLYGDCKRGVEIEVCSIRQDHPLWSGSVSSKNSVLATDIIWSFFSQHPKQ